MKTFKKLLFSFIIFISNPCFGQENGLIKIQKLLQENTDTAFIFQVYNTYELDYPSFKVLSKTKDKISLFEYKIDQTNENESITNKSQRPFDINTSKFYNSINIDSKDAKLFWEKLIKLKPWSIKDDVVEGEGCPEKYINHQTGISFYLIAKEKIQKLKFYAPKYFEKVCATRTGRKMIIKIDRLFERYFKG